MDLAGAFHARQEFRERLFAATVAHAREKVDGYRTLWSGKDHNVRSLADIGNLPIIRKEQMMASPELFRDSSIATNTIQHTTGTTGKPLLIHRGIAELEFIQSFFGALVAHVEDHADVPVRICVGENFHGTPVFLPYPGQVFSIDPRDPYWDHGRILSDPSTMLASRARKIVVSGIESQLRILTCQLLESGFDFAKSQVVCFATTGELITRRMRSWYENIWRVPLLDVYSMTEVFGGAKICQLCGFRHFDPQVIGEVVDPFSEQSIRSGYGVLVATCMSPFVQKQPFIRYWTGDLVRANDTCPSGELGFELKGRAHLSVLTRDATGTVPLVCGAEIYDLLDDFPDVARGRMFVSTPGIADHSALGHLKFRVDTRDENGTLAIAVTIGTNYVHYLYPDRVKELCASVRLGLMQLQPGLKAGLDEGRVRIDINAVSKGQLRSYFPDWVE